MKANPEIRINYSWLLNAGESAKLAEHYKRELLSDEEATKLVDTYRSEWQKHEGLILDMLVSNLGLSFYRDVLDVHIAQLFVPKSEPLIISCMDDPDTFVDTLTHELIHVLLTDNDVIQLNGKDREYLLADDWEAMFGNEHSFTTLVHIPVHALHMSIFENYFKDKTRKQRDLDILTKFNSKDYLKSWDYVDKVGHEIIVAKLKKSYDDLRLRRERPHES